MASSSVTSILFFDTDPQPLAASVVRADPTATVFSIGCPPGTDSDECGTFNDFITIGPWALPSATVTTGTYDEQITVSDEAFTFNLHCEMSATVPATCTTTNIGGNNDGTETVVYTSPASDDSVVGWTYLPVTITEGLEKLATLTATGSGAASPSTSASAMPSSTGPAPTAASTTGGIPPSSMVTGTATTISATSRTGTGVIAGGAPTSTGGAARAGAGVMNFAMYGMLALGAFLR